MSRRSSTEHKIRNYETYRRSHSIHTNVSSHKLPESQMMRATCLPSSDAVANVWMDKETHPFSACGNRYSVALSLEFRSSRPRKGDRVRVQFMCLAMREGPAYGLSLRLLTGTTT